MRHEWTPYPPFVDGMPYKMALDLAYGCRVEITHVRMDQRFDATLKLQLNGVNYEKTFQRTRVEGDTAATVEAWAATEATAHLRTLVALAGDSLRALETP